jgi:hypothetical protein
VSDTISSNILVRRAGITQRQLVHWRYRGLLACTSARPGSGCGPIIYPRSEIAVARVLAVVMPMHGHGSVVTESKILRLVARVRGGERGRVRVAPGVILDLDAIVGDTAE